MVLARHPLCQMCGDTVATVADHIEPLDPRDPRAGNWSLDNGQGLCHGCHARKTFSERRA
jgi:5-methylcytosine-specific restriction endonuclease McrA